MISSPGDAAQPLRFDLRESVGRSFTTLAIDVTQSDVHCATVNLLLDVITPDLIRHSGSARRAGPGACPPYDMSVTDATSGGSRDLHGRTRRAGGPARNRTWVRFRHSPTTHASMQGYWPSSPGTCRSRRSSARTRELAAPAHRTISTAINAVGLSLHADVRADRWMLYHHLSTLPVTA